MGCCVSKSAEPENVPSKDNKGKERETQPAVDNKGKEKELQPLPKNKEKEKEKEKEEEPISTSDVNIVVQAEPEKPAEEDPVAREEKIRKIFNQVDKDNSGFVDLKELKILLEKLSLRVDDISVQFMLARYDDDNNNSLNYEEFSELVLSIMDVKKQFEAADKDKSKSISRSEMQTLLEKKGFTAEISKNIFSVFDEDHTNQVEFNEFVDLMFYVNELEYQYKAFPDRPGQDFSWLKPLLGEHNIAKADEVGKQLLSLKSQKPFPPISEFAKPIVKVAAEGSNNPIGRPRNAYRILTQRTRINPPPKKVMKIQHAETKVFQKPTGPFVDNSFPPSNDILPESARAKVKSWRRIHEINSAAKLFVNGVEEGDVIQGILGDCWFLGALAVVATSAENFIEHLFVQQAPELGYYQCRFFKNGKWEIVEVDDRLPCDALGNLVFAKCKDANEFWVPIVEKAYAKLHGSYEAIESGSIADALKDLTGEGIEVMQLDTDEMKKDSNLAWKILTHNAAESFLMGCAIDSPDKPETELSCGLLSGHAYSIIHCQEVNGNKLVRLRNPWGQGEWNGAWSDFSKEWTAELLQHVNYTFGNDGTFFIAFKDFIQYYSRVYVLRLLTDSTGEIWSKATFEGQWKGESAVGCANHSNWLENPQYAMKVPHDNTKLFINLSQPDLRFVQKKSPSKITSQYDALGLYILKTKNLKYRKFMSEAEERTATSTFTNVRDLSFECTLAAGDYVILPSSFHPGVHTNYHLCVYSDKEIEVSELTQTIPTKSVHGEWKGISAGGCTNNETWLNNPQYLLTCSTGGKVDILLCQEGKKEVQAVGIYVFKSATPSRQNSLASLMQKPSRIINLPILSETLIVEPNTNYIIMPTTFDAGVETKFVVKVTSTEATIETLAPL